MIYKELKNKLNETYLRVEYAEEIKSVVMHWIGFVDTNELMQGMETGLELLSKEKLNRWIADASKMEGGFTEANDWLETNWTPRAQKAGLKTVAFVASSDVFNEFSTKEYAERNQDLDSPHFASVQDAKDWIATK